MTGPAPAVAATRVAVRAALHELPSGLVIVGCSGGADSLALAAATAFEATRAGRPAGAVVVDHGLQPDSAGVAARSRCQRAALGLAPCDVVRVQVGSAGGPEADSRQARYAALADAAGRRGAVAVLLGHTLDDQAEQVLLGLVRGSGARSLAGMPPVRPPFVRPLALGCSRQTHAGGMPRRRTHCVGGPAQPGRRVPPGAGEAGARGGGGAYRPRPRRRPWHWSAGAAAPGRRPASTSRPRPPARVSVQGRAKVTEKLAALPTSLRTRIWRLLAIEARTPPGSLHAAHVAALDDACDGVARRQGPVGAARRRTGRAQRRAGECSTRRVGLNSARARTQTG